MMKFFLIGILFCTSLFAKDVNDGLVAGAGISAAFNLNSNLNISSMSKNDKIDACKNEIKAIKADQSRPFVENYTQAMNIAVNECVKNLK